MTFRYRERARQWLDQRFFREEYDARKILLSLASRVRFETDPADLATMVVNQLDEALHPLMTAILVSGIDEGRLTPVTVLHGSAEPLPLEGGLVVDAPLVGRAARDRAGRSAVAGAAAARRRSGSGSSARARCCWCRSSAQDRSLIAVIALGERRSEEAYTAEDRELLGQHRRADGARVRRRAAAAPRRPRTRSTAIARASSRRRRRRSNR